VGTGLQGLGVVVGVAGGAITGAVSVSPPIINSSFFLEILEPFLNLSNILICFIYKLLILLIY
jgi:hypothetical protein